MEDAEMTDENDPTRTVSADDIPGIDAPYFFCGPCQGRKWLDCDYRQRTENQRRGPTHPDWDPSMVLPCSNCRFHGGGACKCTPTVQTMRESLQAAMSREPSHKANTPKARRDDPMRKNRISELWQGTSNPTPPDFPQDIFPPPPPQTSPPAPLYP